MEAEQPTPQPVRDLLQPPRKRIVWAVTVGVVAGLSLVCASRVNRWWTTDHLAGGFDTGRYPIPELVSVGEEDVASVSRAFADAIRRNDADVLESLCDFSTMANRATFGLPPGSPMRIDENRRVIRYLRLATRALVKNHGDRTRASFLRVKLRRGSRCGLVRLYNEKTAFSYFELLVSDNELGQPVVVDYYSVSEGVWLSEMHRMLFLARLGQQHPEVVSRLPARLQPVVGYANAIAELLARQPPLSPQDYWEKYRTLPAEARGLPVLETRALWAARECQLHEEYRELVDKVRMSEQDAVRRQMLLIDYYATVGDYERLLGAIEDLDEAVGRDPFLLVLKAQTLLLAGQDRAALVTAQEAIGGLPEAEYAYWVAFQAAYQIKSVDAAMKALRRLSEEFGVDIGRLKDSPRYPGLGAMPAYRALLRESAGQ